MSYQPFPAAMFMGTLNDDEGPPVGDGFPDYWHVKSATTTTESSGVPTSGLELIIEAAFIKPDQPYLLIWSAESANSSPGALAATGLYIDDVVIGECRPRTYDNSPQDWHPVGGFRVFEAPAVPVDVSFEIKTYRPAVLGTAMMRNKKITVLKLGDEDSYSQNNVVSTNSTASAVTALSHTMTPGPLGSGPEQGVHLWLMSCSLHTSNAVSGTNFLFDSSDFSHTGRHYGESAERRCIALAIRFANEPEGVPRTVNMKHWRGTAGNSQMDDMCIVCLRLDNTRFVYDKTVDLDVDSSGTETAYTFADGINIDTPEEADHLMLGVVSWEGSNTSLSCFYKVDDGAFQAGYSDQLQ